MNRYTVEVIVAHKISAVVLAESSDEATGGVQGQMLEHYAPKNLPGHSSSLTITVQEVEHDVK